jgi:hypothetical protein
MLMLINDGVWLMEESASDVAKLAKLDVFIVVDRRVAAATGSDCGLTFKKQRSREYKRTRE